MEDDTLAWDVPPVPDFDLTPVDELPSTAGVASLREPPSVFGKSSGAGGGSGKLVHLVAVNRDSTCLGYIGNARSKICLAPKGCEKRAHERDRFVFPDGIQDLVFIGTGASNPAAWASPSAELSWFASTWNRYRSETRSVTQWQTFLEAMMASPAFSDQDVYRMDDAIRTTKEMFTPYKKRTVEVEDASEDGSVSSYQDVVGLAYSPLKPGTDPNTQWTTVVQNFEWLSKMALAAKKGGNELEETLSEVVMRLEARIGELKAVVGTRPAETGTVTVFNTLDTHANEFKEVALLLNTLSLKVTTLEASAMPDVDKLKAVIKGEVYRDMNAALAPLRSLFSKQSTHVTQPGDKLDAEILKMKQELKKLDGLIQQQGLPPVASFPTGASLAWGVANVPYCMSTGGIVPPPTPMSNAVNPDLKALEKKLLRLEQHLDTQSVKVGTTTFGSKADADAWLKINCSTPGGYIFFLDFHSLLALAFGPGGTMADILKLQESAAKLSFSSSEEAIVSASFHLEIPSFLGKPSAGATALSAKILPGLQTYGAWDMGDGEHGLRYDMKYKVKSYVDAWKMSAEFNLSPDALVVAQTMLHTAVAFVDQVSYWITEFFTDCRNKGANDGESWKHISHTLREICSILHDSRKAGRGHYTTAMERASCAFWGHLQAHQEMEVLSARSLVSDPRLSHILNLHLRDNAVMRSEMVKMNDVVRALQRDVAELKKANSKRPAATAGARTAGARVSEE